MDYPFVREILGKIWSQLSNMPNNAATMKLPTEFEGEGLNAGLPINWPAVEKFLGSISAQNRNILADDSDDPDARNDLLQSYWDTCNDEGLRADAAINSAALYIPLTEDDLVQ